MLVETKAKVGVFSIALGAYLPQFPTLVPEFEAQYEAFKKTIPDTVELVDGGIVTTKELSMKAGDKFRAADVDLVILQLLTYATSYNMLPAIRDLNVPVVLVNVQKLKAPDYANTDTPKWLGELYACGAVGEMVADLERAGKRHAVITGVVEGGDDYVAEEIAQWCKAAQVRRRFRYTNIAQIGRPYPGMMDLYIDETNLYNRMGLYTKQFDWEKMWAIADHITDENAIRAKAEDILATFDIAPDKDGKAATVETVWDMARYVVAFEEWVKEEELGMIASHYDGFAQGIAGKLVFLFGYVPTESMEPTLEKGSYVLGFRIYGELEVGDIVIFRHAGKLLVKRIVAVGGGQIEHNGTSLTVPEGCYYVLGDNAECSWDSRHWEEPFVEEDEIVAKTIQGFQPMIRMDH